MHLQYVYIVQWPYMYVQVCCYSNNLFHFCSPPFSPLEYTIILVREGKESLGFSIVGGANSSKGDSPVYIRSVAANSITEEDGRLRPGDEILRINGIPVEGMSQNGVIQLIRSTTGNVTLVIIPGETRVWIFSCTFIFLFFSHSRENQPGVYVVCVHMFQTTSQFTLWSLKCAHLHRLWIIAFQPPTLQGSLWLYWLVWVGMTLVWMHVIKLYVVLCLCNHRLLAVPVWWWTTWHVFTMVCIVG